MKMSPTNRCSEHPYNTAGYATVGTHSNGPRYTDVADLNVRHKIHRMEPRIEIYGVKPHHGWDYMFPLYEQNEIARWKGELEELYPDQEFREHIATGCYINGVLFETRKIKDSLWGYEEMQPQLRTCLTKLLQVAGACFDVLRNRAPLKK